MSTWQLSTPVAFFIFNRPDTTGRVFEAIRRARPARLLVVADGPRPGRGGEAEKCAAARAIIDGVDWPCEVSLDFSDENLGCRRRVSSGLDWVFGLVEEAVILEDDCLPHPTFFRYCEELLEKYRDDDRVMMISGDNFQFGARRTGDSYYFSRYPHVWGWASWRRSWESYDVDMKIWPQIRDEGWLEEYFGDGNSRYWREVFQAVYRGGMSCWAHQFTFACMVHHRLCILPAVNLVSNIGFGADATHTTGQGKLSGMRTEAMQFPLQHPPHMIRDARADRRTEKDQFQLLTIAARLRRLLFLMYQKLGGTLKW